MKKFWQSLRENAMKILRKKRTNKIQLTNEQQESYEKTTIFYICKKMIERRYTNDKIVIKLKTIAIIQVNTEVVHIAYEKRV